MVASRVPDQQTLERYHPIQKKMMLVLSRGSCSILSSSCFLVDHRSLVRWSSQKPPTCPAHQPVVMRSLIRTSNFLVLIMHTNLPLQKPLHTVIGPQANCRFQHTHKDTPCSFYHEGHYQFQGRTFCFHSWWLMLLPALKECQIDSRNSRNNVC